MQGIHDIRTEQPNCSYFPIAQAELPRMSMTEKQMVKATVEQIVANVFSVSIQQINSASRNRAQVAFARQTAMYLSHVVCGLNFSEVGTLFKRDRTTVSHACKCIEDYRDDLSFDKGMEFLESATLLFLGSVKSKNGEIL